MINEILFLLGLLVLIFGAILASLIDIALGCRKLIRELEENSIDD